MYKLNKVNEEGVLTHSKSENPKTLGNLFSIFRLNDEIHHSERYVDHKYPINGKKSQKISSMS